jgi:hypothetical protein
MKKLLLFTILFHLAVSVSAQFEYTVSKMTHELYNGVAPYPKTPFSGEFSIPRIAADIDTITYLKQFVGGSAPYYVIKRSADGYSDLYCWVEDKSYTFIRSYDDENNLLSVVCEYTDMKKRDTLMLFSYDEQGRILKRAEYFDTQEYYKSGGHYPDYFFIGINELDITGGGKPAIYTTDYDYENNTIQRQFIYLRNTSERTDTITRVYNSTISYNENGYTVETTGSENGDRTEHDRTDYLFDVQNRLIQAGDVYYTYHNNGFTEKKDDVEFRYIFNDKGYLAELQSTDILVNGPQWFYTQNIMPDNAVINAFNADSAIWKHYYRNVRNEESGTFEIRMKGDTIIDGVMWRKLIGQSFYSYSDGQLLIRTDKQKVICRDDSYNKEFVLYDFSLNEGDFISWPSDQEDSKLEIIKVDSIEICGTKRKALYYLEPYIYAIEGIGSPSGPLEPITPRPTGDYWEWTLAYCFSDGEII